MTDATDTQTYERLYRETIPSVVSVYVTPEGDDRGRRGAGSGFVYDRTHVVTNQHVVGDATEVDLRFSERDWRRGRVVGTDAYTDLAVVAVEDLPAYATPLELVDESPTPGSPVAALGNPMGLDGSISAGIVSGSFRSIPTGNGFAIPDTVQTDAPINPGNSGGPLVPLDGRVVGVNRARTGDNIEFTVSAEVIRRVVPTDRDGRGPPLLPPHPHARRLPDRRGSQRPRGNRRRSRGGRLARAGQRRADRLRPRTRGIAAGRCRPAATSSSPSAANRSTPTSR